MLELVHLYSNQHSLAKRLLRLHATASSARRPRQQPTSRQRQVRLDPLRIKELTQSYLSGASHKALAERFGVHRTTVTAVLLREGVVLSPNTRRRS
jgi:hypothetical protein